MRITNLVILALVVFAMSCQPSGPTMTPSGYEYSVEGTGTGEKAKEGDFVMFTFKVVADNGEVLQENNNADNLPAMQITGPEVKLQQPNPVLDVFRDAQVGQNISMKMPVDSLPGKNMQLQGMEYITYEMEIKDIKSQEEYDQMLLDQRTAMEEKAKAVKARLPEVEEMTAKVLADFKAGNLDLKTTESGLQYVIHEEGTGETGKAGQTASVFYHGLMYNGESFDSAFNRGNPFQFIIGRGSVIKGWDEALQLVKPGSKASLFIPSDLAYGKTGNAGIAPDSDLYFYIEVPEIN